MSTIGILLNICCYLLLYIIENIFWKQTNADIKLKSNLLAKHVLGAILSAIKTAQTYLTTSYIYILNVQWWPKVWNEKIISDISI